VPVVKVVQQEDLGCVAGPQPTWNVLHRRPNSPDKLRRFVTTTMTLFQDMSQMLANFVPRVGQPPTQDEQIALARASGADNGAPSFLNMFRRAIAVHTAPPSSRPKGQIHCHPHRSVVIEPVSAQSLLKTGFSAVLAGDFRQILARVAIFKGLEIRH